MPSFTVFYALVASAAAMITKKGPFGTDGDAGATPLSVQPFNNQATVWPQVFAHLPVDDVWSVYAMLLRTIGFLVVVAFVFIAAAIYRACKVDPEVVPKPEEWKTGQFSGRFKFGIFDCLGDAGIMMASLFCSPLRWADTMRMAGFMGFWAGVALFLCMEFFSYVTLGITAIVTVGICVYYRQKFRAIFAMESGTWNTYCLDILAYCCCPLCAIAQEARHMEEAYEVGHEVTKLGAPSRWDSLRT